MKKILFTFCFLLTLLVACDDYDAYKLDDPKVYKWKIDSYYSGSRLFPIYGQKRTNPPRILAAVEYVDLTYSDLLNLIEQKKKLKNQNSDKYYYFTYTKVN